MQFGRIVIHNRTEQNRTEQYRTEQYRTEWAWRKKQNNRERTPNKRSGIVNASLCREIGTSCILRVILIDGDGWGKRLVNVETLARYLVVEKNELIREASSNSIAVDR
jgi:hypothetical protein